MNKKCFKVTFSDGSKEYYSVEELGDKLPKDPRLAIKNEIVDEKETVPC